MWQLSGSRPCQPDVEDAAVLALSMLLLNAASGLPQAVARGNLRTEACANPGLICPSLATVSHLAHHNFPALVALTETFLDVSVKTPTLTSYTLISRRDRSAEGSGGFKGSGGGIMLFALDRLAPFLVHIGNSQVSERSWRTFHCNQGPLLICIWYRPPAYNEVGSILALEEEWLTHRTSTLGTLITGDLNVHHKPWLTHPPGPPRKVSLWKDFAESMVSWNVCSAQLVASIYLTLS